MAASATQLATRVMWWWMTMRNLMAKLSEGRRQRGAASIALCVACMASCVHDNKYGSRVLWGLLRYRHGLKRRGGVPAGMEPAPRDLPTCGVRAAGTAHTAWRSVVVCGEAGAASWPLRRTKLVR